MHLPVQREGFGTLWKFSGRLFLEKPPHVRPVRVRRFFEDLRPTGFS